MSEPQLKRDVDMSSTERAEASIARRRDSVAARAMAALIAHHGVYCPDEATLAKRAYSVADAMERAR